MVDDEELKGFESLLVVFPENLEFNILKQLFMHCEFKGMKPVVMATLRKVSI